MVLGLTNCIGSIPGFVAQTIASSIINGDEGNVSKWRNVWIITIVILMVETVTFIIFADGKPQKWNAPKENKEKEGKRDLILVSFDFINNLVGFLISDILHSWHCPGWCGLCWHHDGST